MMKVARLIRAETHNARRINELETSIGNLQDIVWETRRESEQTRERLMEEVIYRGFDSLHLSRRITDLEPVSARREFES